MDPTKWKSIAIPIKMHEQLAFLAKAEGRTLSGQFRVALSYYIEKKKQLKRMPQDVLARKRAREEAQKQSN